MLGSSIRLYLLRERLIRTIIITTIMMMMMMMMIPKVITVLLATMIVKKVLAMVIRINVSQAFLKLTFYNYE